MNIVSEYWLLQSMTAIGEFMPFSIMIPGVVLLRKYWGKTIYPTAVHIAFYLTAPTVACFLLIAGILLTAIGAKRTPGAALDLLTIWPAIIVIILVFLMSGLMLMTATRTPQASTIMSLLMVLCLAALHIWLYVSTRESRDYVPSLEKSNLLDFNVRSKSGLNQGTRHLFVCGAISARGHSRYSGACGQGTRSRIQVQGIRVMSPTPTPTPAMCPLPIVAASNRVIFPRPAFEVCGRASWGRPAGQRSVRSLS